VNPHNMRHLPTRDTYVATVTSPDPEAPPVDHTVEITPADQLRAEILGYEQGLGPMSKAPLHYTVAWIYAALTRTGLYADTWRTFVDRDLYAWGPADDLEQVEENPTQGSVRFDSD
jgi:hypothetical protein